MSDWTLEPTDPFSRNLKWYAKKRPRELQAVLDNLDTFHEALNAGALPQQVRVGFIHPEPQGILAVDQKGGGANLQQTRLYMFPWVPTKTIYLLALGDKRSQSDDIRLCRQTVDELLLGLSKLTEDHDQSSLPQRDGDDQGPGE